MSPASAVVLSCGPELRVQRARGQNSIKTEAAPAWVAELPRKVGKRTISVAHDSPFQRHSHSWIRPKVEEAGWEMKAGGVHVSTRCRRVLVNGGQKKGLFAAMCRGVCDGARMPY